MDYIDYYKLKNNKSIIERIRVGIYNKKYIKNMLLETKELLDNINGYPLDKSQRIAVLTDEISNLVVAGAGSGKTLTIIGKIRYLIEYKKIDPRDILCISFTRDATKSLKNKLISIYNYDIDVFTFHKLAINVLKGKNINLCSDNLLKYITSEYFYLVDNKELIKYNNEQTKKLILTFINLFKCNGYNLNKFIKIVNKNNKDLLSIIVNIYLLYSEELKSTNSMDFNDLIIEATNYVKQYGIYHNYKYIIIDEYQDTSYIRYLFIKSIINKTKAKIMVVGDDWQSIYKFTGCDLNVFINFKKYFKKTKILYINNTYRNSKELINITGKFIMKNPKQMKKKLNSNKRNNKPIKIIKERKDILTVLLDYLNTKDMKDILILGRNNNDIKQYTDIVTDCNGYIKYNNMNVRYLTVHKSKGLEEENIILINLYDCVTGFPNKIKDDEILNELKPNIKSYLYDEERRLFYVALTRTKNNVFLIVPNKKSVFVEEIQRENGKYIEYLSI